jgi:ABC transport system ATP-binding/permease protein
MLRMTPVLLALETISKQYSERPLLQNVTLSINANERIGIVGTNGSGKTTLLRIIAGVEQPDAGRVNTMRNLRMAYLPQNPALTPQLSVLAQIFQADTPLLRLVRSYEEASSALSHAPDNLALQNQLTIVVEQMNAADAWGIEQQARTILTKLGISDLEARVGDLSGGLRKRVALASALINPTDLLILDEPTNHIDTATIAWLEEFLARSNMALLLVTHDRYVLERVCQRIVEVDSGSLYTYPGSYRRFLELKAERLGQVASEESRRKTILKKEMVWLQRGARARTTKQQARIDRIELMQAAAPESQRGPVEIGSLTRRLGKKVIELRAVSKSYGQQLLIRDLTLSIGAGDRVGILGPNGSGKTTLLNMIAGQIAPDTGTIELGETVHLTYYDQESGGLDESLRMIDYIKAGAELVQTAEGALLTAAQMLERFLFAPSSHYTQIARLSGGERRRLYLLRKLIDAPNVLLLDEPTNDLDIQTLTVLEDYLDTFAGTVIVVSHDRYFLDRIAERTLAFADGVVTEYPGGYSAYAEAITRRDMVAEAPARAKPKPASTPPSQARPRKLSFAERKELHDLEQRIGQLEAEQANLAAQIAATSSDYQLIQRLSTQLEQVTQALDSAVERWSVLAEIAEAS